MKPGDVVKLKAPTKADISKYRWIVIAVGYQNGEWFCKRDDGPRFAPIRIMKETELEVVNEN